MQVYEGNILSVDQNDGVYRYLVEDEGKILYVGDSLPAKYASVRRMQLGQRALIPAFVDTHQHLASYSTFHAGLNVMEAESNAEMAKMIETFAKNAKEKKLIAFGASPYSVAEGRLISREELDAVCPDKELMVVKYDGHACVVNSKLLKRLVPKLKDLRGYHPDSGEMNQEAFFECSNDISNSISLLKLFSNMQKAVDSLAEQGIGCVHTVSGVGFAGDLDITFESIFAKSLKNGMQIRVFPQSMDIQTALSRKLPRIGGCFRCALDGCFGSADAALLEPYADGKEGVLYYSDETVTEFCKQANRAGLQIELHAIGDAAFRQACLAMKAALDDFPREDHRHGIIHACLPTEEGITICKEYHIQLPVQSAFIGWKQEPDSYLEELLGAERASRLNPLRDFWDAGIALSAGSDAPCTDPNPISWMDRAVNHSNPAQALTIREALRMCTYQGYYATFDEGRRGSLGAGKVADMVILSENPYEIPKEELKNLKVQQLLLGGKPYRSAQTAAVPAILLGVLRKEKC